MERKKEEKAVERKNIAAIVITMLVLFASLTYFPWLGAGFGWGGIGFRSFILTCVFVSVWLIALFFVAVARSKALINTYLCYWLVIAGVCALFLTLMHITPGGMLASYLFIIFLTPIIGIDYLFSNPFNETIFFIPVCMHLLGLFIKIKFIKKLPKERSG